MRSKPKPRSTALLRLDADERIIADLLCVKCGANLRGCHVSDRCPNCYHPASDSVHGDYLIHSDREVVQGLAEAARLVELASAVLGVLMVVALATGVISARSLEVAVERAFRVVLATAVLTPVIATLGLVLLTTRHSAAYYWVRYGNPRGLLRVGLGLAGLVALLVVAWHLFGVIALRVGTVLWFGVPMGAFLRGIRQLMRRVPNNPLAAYAQAMFAGLLAFAALAVLTILLRDWPGQTAQWRDSQLALSAISTLAGLGLGVAGFSLVVRVRRTLHGIRR